MRPQDSLWRPRDVISPSDLLPVIMDSSRRLYSKGRVTMTLLLTAFAVVLSSCTTAFQAREFGKEPAPTLEPSDSTSDWEAGAENIANQLTNAGIDSYNNWMQSHKDEIDETKLHWGNPWQIDLSPTKNGLHIDGHDVLRIYVQPGQVIILSTNDILFWSNVKGEIPENSQVQQYADIPLEGGADGNVYYIKAGGENGGTADLASPAGADGQKAVCAWGQ